MSSEQSSGLIAIVDDDISVQSALQDLIESDGLSTVCFGSAEEFLASGAEQKAGCLIADIRMPGMSGIELQAKLKANRCRIPIVFITAHGDARMRIQAMRDGAVEFLTKPFDKRSRGRNGSCRRRGLLEDAEARESKSIIVADQERRVRRFEQIIGNSPALTAVLKQAERVAAMDTTVLIHGETGTGNELIAHAIHNASPRSGQPLVKLNCAAIPFDLLESEL